MALPALAALAALVAGTFVLPDSVPGVRAAGRFLPGLAPAAALAAAVLAARRVPGVFGSPWVVLGGAAAFAFLDFLLTAVSAVPSAGLHGILTAGAMALFAAGIGWILHQRDRTPAVELAVDVGLVLLAVTVATLHLAPGVAAVASAGAAAPGVAVGAVGAPVAAGCGALLAAALVVVGGRSPAGLASPAAALAGILFGLAVAPHALGYGACCQPGSWSGLAWAGGWLALAYAGVRAAAGSPPEFLPAGVDGGGSRLRLAVAPIVAAVMAAVLVDASLRGPMQPATAVGMGLLGLALALRVSQLLYATRAHDAARVKLNQSRALIEVSHALSGTRDLDDTLKLVSYWAVQLLQARGASIELLSEDGRELEVHTAMGLPETMVGERIPVAGTFTGSVVSQGLARATPESGGDPLVDRALLQNLPLAAVPLRYADSTFGTLTCVGRYPFSSADVELLGAFAEQAAVAIETARLFRQVHQLSMTDPLTGLANRRQLERDLNREFAAARRGRQLVAVMFDLNGFKQFNDTAGHLLGDEALRRFGAALGRATRAMNMAARYGGDEFLALLADTDGTGAETFISRVREAFPGAGADERFNVLSVAAGYARFDPCMQSPEDLIAAADQALYRDKAAWAASSRASR